MREIRTQIEIAAPAQTVWSVLTDFAAFAEWNPFIVRAEGQLVTGNRLAVTLRPPGHRATRFRPTVLSVEPGRAFRWLGHLGLPGIFDGRHIHEIEVLGPERVRYIQREEFTGALVPLLGSMLRDAERGFGAMNAALKERAEGLASQPG